MSRVHDALRRAAQQNAEVPNAAGKAAASRNQPTPANIEPPPTPSPFVEETATLIPNIESAAPDVAGPAQRIDALAVTAARLVDTSELDDIENVIRNARETPYTPLPEALLVNPVKPREAPAEEFRTLRTRLNHLQSLQPLHTLVVTSASPAEGKSFTATNLAVTQSQLADKRVLLADFDFRRPAVDKTFQIDCSPGITDYLQGKARLSDILRRVADSQLYLMTAGESVLNPLELLNLKECKALIQALRDNFDWVILDSPPLLFAADGNLLATMCDGTILVVRIGATTFDSVSRALQSLCENNVLGIVVNGARRGELYSKYTYYHDYYYAPDTQSEEAAEPQETEEEAVPATK
jgi:protein-tyrosine kinase